MREHVSSQGPPCILTTLAAGKVHVENPCRSVHIHMIVHLHALVRAQVRVYLHMQMRMRMRVHVHVQVHVASWVHIHEV